MKNPSGDRWRLDCRTMPAPFPLLGARAAMRLMAPGDVLALLATDPDAVADVPAWCRLTGHHLLRRRRVGGVTGFLIRKRAASSDPKRPAEGRSAASPRSF